MTAPALQVDQVEIERLRPDSANPRKISECIGCIEAGLFEIVRALVMAEQSGAPEGTEAPAASAAASLAATTVRRNDDGG